MKNKCKHDWSAWGDPFPSTLPGIIQTPAVLQARICRKCAKIKVHVISQGPLATVENYLSGLEK